jgi:hypothetical protein
MLPPFTAAYFYMLKLLTAIFEEVPDVDEDDPAYKLLLNSSRCLGFGPSIIL